MIDPCRYRSQVSHDTCACSHWNVHSPTGLVPVSICNGCALREEPHQVEPLDYSESVVNFVWVYWHGGAIGDEIRWSIRSIESCAMFPHRITIIGDRPSWYTGHFVSKPQIRNAKSNLGITDQLSKTILMSEHPDILDDCVWMMDDIYALRPFTLHEIMIPRAVPHRRSGRNNWQLLKTETINACIQSGIPKWDFATHAPHYVSRPRLRETIAKFNLKERTLIWEILYGNMHLQRPPAGIRPWLRRIKEKVSKSEAQKLTASSTFMNHTEGAWCSGIRDYLLELFPSPSSVEEDGAFPEPSKNGSPASVRRRPPHLRDKAAYHQHLRAIGVLK